MDFQLNNYIRYCLGYIKLTNRSTFLTQQHEAISLEEEYLNLLGLLNGESDGELGEKINLSHFYSYAPLDVPPELKSEYVKEKILAQKIEDLYAKYKNDQFTKQVVITFGYFTISLTDNSAEEVENQVEEPIEQTEQISLLEEEPKPEQETSKRYPLFTLPVRIEKNEGVYSLYYTDQQLQVNINILQDVLGETLYYQLVDKLGVFEIDGKLSLPQTDLSILEDIWRLVKTQLKLKDVYFEDDSFVLNEIKLSITPKVNYFLVEDLQKLISTSDEELLDTSITSWTDDSNLSISSDVPSEHELYFPFFYDKYKLKVLSVINNKAAIVEGPPGTGKSETIANLVCHLAADGKKVLFVSQKTQALKVVKDKLKKLDVKYLFGYIPNPLSQQSTEEDEHDSVGAHLAGLSNYMQQMVYRDAYTKHDSLTSSDKQGSIQDTTAGKHSVKSKFNKILDSERKIYKIKQELKQFQSFDNLITDISLFNATCTNETLDHLKSLFTKEKEYIDKLQSMSSIIHPEEFTALFQSVNTQRIRYAEEVKAILDDLEKTGYDRHGKIGRTVNNTLRNLRLSKQRSVLSREFIDYIDTILNQDYTRDEAHKHVKKLYHFIDQHDTKNTLEELEGQIADQIKSSGLSLDEKKHLESLLNSLKSDELLETLKKLHALKDELNQLYGEIDYLNSLANHLHETEDIRQQKVKQYIQNIIDAQLRIGWQQGIKMRQISQKLAKAFGQSKRAFKTFDNLRKDPTNFKSILDIIPVWIMELDDASRIVPLEPSLFDYVIIDEASQCNVAYTLPVMFRAKHALFFGDSEQMRDTTVRFKSNTLFSDLARRYNVPESLQIKATKEAVQSVLDIAKLRGFTPIPLQYHYRSPAELIGFSNQYFYEPKGKSLIALNNKYLPYKDTNRIIVVHEIEANDLNEIGNNTNIAEAEAIVNLFKELKSDPMYEDKSIGILTFFNAQATLIRHLFEQEGFTEDNDNYKISIIEGIQGDEKDIVLYSFVIRSSEQKRMYVPLTGEGGDINGAINGGRVNVAFSRAKLQAHVFTSLPLADFPDKIWLKRYLQYAYDYGEIKTYTDLNQFDSYFEEEFCQTAHQLLGQDYRIQNQVESCGFKLDFVITNVKNGKRIAVECDGPTHFKDEIDESYGIYTDSDIERQDVLEAAGWRFYRVQYSHWTSNEIDNNKFFDDIRSLLN